MGRLEFVLTTKTGNPEDKCVKEFYDTNFHFIQNFGQ